jgi:hypothetical protein
MLLPRISSTILRDHRLHAYAEKFVVAAIVVGARVNGPGYSACDFAIRATGNRCAAQIHFYPLRRFCA